MKPTPTDHLIHWLNTHPHPNEVLPGTSVRFADAHDDLVDLIDDYSEAEETLNEEIALREDVERKLDAIVFRAKQDLDRIINAENTSTETKDALEELLCYIEDYEQ